MLYSALSFSRYFLMERVEKGCWSGGHLFCQARAKALTLSNFFEFIFCTLLFNLSICFFSIKFAALQLTKWKKNNFGITLLSAAMQILFSTISMRGKRYCVCICSKQKQRNILIWPEMSFWKTFYVFSNCFANILKPLAVVLIGNLILTSNCNKTFGILNGTNKISGSVKIQNLKLNRI